MSEDIDVFSEAATLTELANSQSWRVLRMWLDGREKGLIEKLIREDSPVTRAQITELRFLKELPTFVATAAKAKQETDAQEQKEKDEAAAAEESAHGIF